MVILLDHPEVSDRSCSDCKKWFYDDNGPGMGRTKMLSRRTGEPLPRPPGSTLPCWKCPKGPEPFKKEMSAKNLAAYLYYRRCIVDTTGILPRDAIVIRNNSIIRSVEDAIFRSKFDCLQALIPLIGKR